MEAAEKLREATEQLVAQEQEAQEALSRAQAQADEAADAAAVQAVQAVQAAGREAEARAGEREAELREEMQQM